MKKGKAEFTFFSHSVKFTCLYSVIMTTLLLLSESARATSRCNISFTCTSSASSLCFSSSFLATTPRSCSTSLLYSSAFSWASTPKEQENKKKENNRRSSIKAAARVALKSWFFQISTTWIKLFSFLTLQRSSGNVAHSRDTRYSSRKTRENRVRVTYQALLIDTRYFVESGT